MQTLMPSKHRCTCFSQQSSSFLYGLRREAPSTQRVLLERLLNVLSRVAAHKSKNPQRLWADSERPDWWTKVTDLKWKNPREHPKDNKETLKKKIEVLERELERRHLMTEDLKSELAAHRESKKVDLELKSDFEAVIAKASGLHYMLDKVSNKMGQSRVISDKIATYISETKACLDQCVIRINGMFQQVEAREKRKSSLWETMGVSKRQRSELFEDLDTDCSEMDFDPTSPGAFHLLDILDPSSPVSSSPLSPSPTSMLPVPTSSEETTVLTSASITPQPNPRSIPSPPTLPIPKVAVHVQRSLSPPSYTQPVSEPQYAMDLSMGKSAALSFFSFAPPAKKSRRHSADEEKEKKKVRVVAGMQSAPRGILRQTQMLESMVEDVVVDDDVEIVGYSQTHSAAVGHLPSGARVFSGGAGSGGKTPAEAETQRREELRQRRNPHDRPKSFGARSNQQLTLAEPGVEHRRYSSLPTAHGFQSGTSEVTHTAFADRAKPSRSPREKTLPVGAGSATASFVHATETSTLATDDLTVDSGEMSQHDLDNVEAIIEESPTPTISMYAADVSGMDQLVEMTIALSCEDLRPSVMEPVVSDLSVDHLSSMTLPGGPVKVCSGYQAARRPDASANGLSSTGDQSLSKAIGDLRGQFPS